MSTPSDTQKFRPYFTAAELSEIIRCVKTVSTNQSLLAYLEAFAMKIDRGILQPQITIQPSLESKLGMELAKIQGPTPTELFRQWQTNPASLTAAQLSTVHTYRWENGFMTDEEASKFEQELFDGTSSN